MARFKNIYLCQIQTLTLLLLEARVILPTLWEAIFSCFFEELKVSGPDEEDKKN